jgi:cysteinyl-tRNA synthetase
MLLKFLGESVDIHTGGIDLRFPHHEDERAQTDSVAGHEVVRHWVHAEHLLFEGRKMSKSAGNVVLLRDVTDRGFNSRALRLAFLQQHYRSQVDLSWDAIAAANRLLTRWIDCVRGGAGHAAPDGQVVESVLSRFSDDLDTAGAISLVRDLERSSQVSDEVRAATMLACDVLLGLGLAESAATTIDVPSEIAALADARAEARAHREWALSDALRAELSAAGWDVADGPEGQTLRPRER